MGNVSVEDAVRQLVVVSFVPSSCGRKFEAADEPRRERPVPVPPSSSGSI